ncbi:MAG: hypothetical protein QXD03_03710 [Candidatus Anstonellales archaeon]
MKMIRYDKSFLELQKRAGEALNRIKTLNESNADAKITKRKSVLELEVFNEDDFNKKLELDSCFWRVLIENIDKDEDKSSLVNEIDDIYDKVKRIYEYMNIKPRVYNEIVFEGLGSDELRIPKAKEIIMEYIDLNFYSLSQSERDRRYGGKVKQFAESLVLEYSIDVDRSIEISYKKIIIESLINKILFPGFAYSRLNEIVNEKSDEFFDNSEIVSLYEDIVSKISDISTAIAVYV